jgi:hypothetical protein
LQEKEVKVMGWMCVQTPYPPKEQPDNGEGGSNSEDNKKEQCGKPHIATNT